MCIFCKIIAGEIPSYKVYEDEKVLAMLDISQATIGHTLVLPKAHFEDIHEIDADTLSHLFKVVKKISDHYHDVLPGMKGINILNNNGEAAGQTVKHYHVHILPRYEDDDLVDMKFIDHGAETDFNLLLNTIKLD